MEKRPGEIVFLVAVLAALAFGFLALIPPGFSSDEEAVQYVQMRNVSLNGSLEIRLPAFSLGFEAADFDGRRGLFESRNGGLHAVTPPLFAWIVSLFYSLLGEGAVVFVPILFLFLSTLVMGLVLDRLMPRGLLYWLLLAAFIVGSPVFMQGLLFSGMSLGLLLVVSALWLATAHFMGNPSAARLFGASVLMGSSMLARPEFLPAALVFHLCAAIVLTAQERMKDLALVLVGCAVCMCAFVFHDTVLHGRFPGPYLQLMMPFFTLSPVRLAALAGAATVSFALLLLSRKERISAFRKAVLSILSVMLILGAVLVTAARITVSHLMALFPAVLFVFCGIPERIDRLKARDGILEAILSASIAVALVLGASLLRPGAWIALSVWLPLIPLVIVLLALERRTLFAAPGMIAVLAFFCGVAIVNGMQESRDRIMAFRYYNAARVAFLEKHTATGDAVLFDDAGSLQHAGPLCFDRIFLVAKGPDDRERLALRLRERGVDGIYAWTFNPLSIRGFNPYGGEAPPVFPPPQGAKSCCSGSCKGRDVYLVKLNVREPGATGTGRGV